MHTQACEIPRTHTLPHATHTKFYALRALLEEPVNPPEHLLLVRPSGCSAHTTCIPGSFVLSLVSHILQPVLAAAPVEQSDKRQFTTCCSHVTNSHSPTPFGPLAFSPCSRSPHVKKNGTRTVGTAKSRETERKETDAEGSNRHDRSSHVCEVNIAKYLSGCF